MSTRPSNPHARAGLRTGPGTEMQQTRVRARCREKQARGSGNHRDWPEARLASWVAVRRASQAASRRDSAISWLPGGEGGVLALESGREGGISVVRKEALGFLGLEPLVSRVPRGQGRTPRGFSGVGATLAAASRRKGTRPLAPAGDGRGDSGKEAAGGWGGRVGGRVEETGRS